MRAPSGGADIDGYERERVIAQRRKRLLTQAGDPQVDELPGLDVHGLVEGEQRDVVADAVIAGQRHGPEAHVDVVAHHRLRPLAGAVEVRFEVFEIAPYLFAVHAALDERLRERIHAGCSLIHDENLSSTIYISNVCDLRTIR